MKKRILIVYVGFLLGNHNRGDMIRIDNMIKSLQTMGYQVHILGFYNSHFGNLKKEWRWLRSKNIVPHLYYAFPFRFGLLRWSIFMRRLITWVVCRWNSIDVIQLEIASSSNTVAFLKNIPIVVDFHSDLVPELEMDCAKKRYINQAIKDNIYALQRADVVISVSNRLLSNLEKYSVKSISKHYILPCCYDDSIYGRINRDLRAKMRRDLGIEDRIVLCYLGGLSGWQCIDETLDCMTGLLSMDHRYFCCLYTADPNVSKYKAKIEKLKGNILVNPLNHQNIAQYMSVIDVGFVLRTDSLVNMNASPTKTSEYMAAGAMVVTTIYAGDAPQIVKESGCGIVLDDEIINVTKLRQIDRCIKDYISSYDVNSLHAKQYIFETRRWAGNEMKLKEIYNSVLKI